MTLDEAVLDTGAILHAIGLLPRAHVEVAVRTAHGADAVLQQLLEWAADRWDDVTAAQFALFDLVRVVQHWVPTADIAETALRLMMDHPGLECAQAATIAASSTLRLPIVTTNPSLPVPDGTVVIVLR